MTTTTMLQTTSITAHDAQQVQAASSALLSAWRKAESSRESGQENESPARPSHEEEKKDEAAVLHKKSTANESLSSELYQAAQQCQDETLRSLLERLRGSLPDDHVAMGLLVLHDCSVKEKLQELVQAFGESNKNDESTLNRQGVMALLRCVLVAIQALSPHSESSSDKQLVVVEGQPEASKEPPRKKVKRDSDETHSTKLSTKDEEDQEFRPCQSPSFDSSLATLRDEDELGSSPNKRVQEMVAQATEDMLEFAQDRAISSELLHQWYKAERVPWMQLLDLANWKAKDDKKKVDEDSPASLKTEEDEPSSKTLVSFDFSGAMDDPTPLCIHISEDNLVALQQWVYRAGLVHQPASQLCKIIVQLAAGDANTTKFVLSRSQLEQHVMELYAAEAASSLTPAEQQAFLQSLLCVFSCFEENTSSLQTGQVDAKEFAIGMCLLCAGNKSTKLAVGFELFGNGNKKNSHVLSKEQLSLYLQSYLTMLVALSLLVPMSKKQKQISLPRLDRDKRRALQAAVLRGAQWTLGHFIKYLTPEHVCVTKDEYSFEVFANWYSVGGYNVAPWLELLDLNKTFSLLPRTDDSPIQLPPLTTNHHPTTTERRVRRDRVSTLRRHHSSRRGPPPEILFTFPLARNQSLIVLKEDATYVRGVVEQLGLLQMTPDDLWAALSNAVEKRRKGVKKQEGALYVNLETFVQCMQDVCPRLSRKRPATGSSTPSSSVQELLSNFFQCFDLDQIDSVALDELMGGLCLLCGGKKSHKLAFAFGVFDTRPEIQRKKKKAQVIYQLKGEDLFLFLRSILIVTFSCLRQSLDMTDEMVSQCITDTANMICNDVMHHQFQKRQTDSLNFDDFGEWYNEGGFERATWLELLDLKKWVLLDTFDHFAVQLSAPPPPMSSARLVMDPTCPPPPPEDALDPGFFDEHNLMPMDSIDEMDMIFMAPSADGDDRRPLSKSFSFSPRSRDPREQQPTSRRGIPLKFRLVTNQNHGGYVFSLSPARIQHFRQLVEQTGLIDLDTETASNQFLKASRSTKNQEPMLTRDAYKSVIRSFLSPKGNRKVKADSVLQLSDVLADVFDAFDRKGTGKVSVDEVACGFTVLCKGKKSDKLELAFELMDKKKKGCLSESGMADYLRSFLTVLMGIAFSRHLSYDEADDIAATIKGGVCERSSSTIFQSVDHGAKWAADLVFREVERRKGKSEASMTFDEFATWYSVEGFKMAPWLELLDLQKWVLCETS